MNKYSTEELEKALEVLSSTIVNCEKMKAKFAEGTSQHSLLRNRLKALYISQVLMRGENIEDKYNKEELVNALPPILSIISKCEKGQKKFEEGNKNYKRFKNIIDSMYISKTLITNEISKRF